MKKIVILFCFPIFLSAQTKKSAASEVESRIDKIENYLNGKESMEAKLPNTLVCLTGITPEKVDGTYIGSVYYPTLEDVYKWREWLKKNGKFISFKNVQFDNDNDDDEWKEWEEIIFEENGKIRSSICE